MKHPLKKYSRLGRECYFDAIRGKLILATPEEGVRQRFVMELVASLGWPVECITVEESLSHHGGGNLRADIVLCEATAGESAPVGIVECKAPGVPLTSDVEEQALAYALRLDCRFYAITNGSQLRVYELADGASRQIRDFPSREEALRGSLSHIEEVEDSWDYVRVPWKALIGPRLQRQIDHAMSAGEFSSACPPELAPYVIDFAGLLFAKDTYPYDFVPCRGMGVEILEDAGLLYRNFGNSAGGGWDADYRVLLCRDLKTGDSFVASVSLMSWEGCTDDPAFGNRNPKTIILCAIGDGEKDQSSLQLRLEKHLVAEGRSGALLTHDGAMTAGSTVKREVVRNYIRECAPELLDGPSRILLGRHDGKACIAGRAAADMLLRLVAYSYYRLKLRHKLHAEWA
ncbi:MAG: type I restriction enzyme HsdR N-terminal domain-containing protein [Candidatus Sumerlaeia bacterium]|nr:type I restriction enzyme HsdR N-terminal domain-containing protein [Candidatus Sumerlaeia bacterium]